MVTDKWLKEFWDDLDVGIPFSVLTPTEKRNLMSTMAYQIFCLGREIKEFKTALIKGCYKITERIRNEQQG